MFRIEKVQGGFIAFKGSQIAARVNDADTPDARTVDFVHVLTVSEIETLIKAIRDAK